MKLGGSAEAPNLLVEESVERGTLFVVSDVMAEQVALAESLRDQYSAAAWHIHDHVPCGLDAFLVADGFAVSGPPAYYALDALCMYVQHFRSAERSVLTSTAYELQAVRLYLQFADWRDAATTTVSR